jgi:hypothetical protein
MFRAENFECHLFVAMQILQMFCEMSQWTGALECMQLRMFVVSATVLIETVIANIKNNSFLTII